MLILILDDQEIRHSVAARIFGRNHKILNAYNSGDAIDILETCTDKIGLAMLDHDLQDFVSEAGVAVPYEFPGKKTERHGMFFLNEMFKLHESYWPSQFVIHSHNVAGSQNMYDALKANKQVVNVLPFCGESLVKIADSIRGK